MYILYQMLYQRALLHKHILINLIYGMVVLAIFVYAVVLYITYILSICLKDAQNILSHNPESQVTVLM